MTHYSDEFREEAVQLVLDGKSSAMQISKDIGVNVWTLREWVKKHHEKSRAISTSRGETLEEANRRLKRELNILKQERDLSKKAAAYFANEQL